MADISDVENALVTAIEAAVYPNGTGQPSAIGAPCRVYRGWPVAPALDADLAAGVVNISVVPGTRTQNTTRFPLEWETISLPVPTITVATVPPTVTFGGVAGAGNLCGIRANGTAYAYAAAPTDMPQAVAAALAAQIPSATASGPAVTISGAADLLGRVVGIGTALMETRRQDQNFSVTCWCPTPASRDIAGSVVDSSLAALVATQAGSGSLTLADGTGGLLRYSGVALNDEPSKDALWRRVLVYSVEYPTTRTMTAAEMLFGLGSTTVMVEGVATVTTNWEPQ